MPLLESEIRHILIRACTYAGPLERATRDATPAAPYCYQYRHPGDARPQVSRPYSRHGAYAARMRHIVMTALDELERRAPGMADTHGTQILASNWTPPGAPAYAFRRTLAEQLTKRKNAAARAAAPPIPTTTRPRGRPTKAAAALHADQRPPATPAHAQTLAHRLEIDLDTALFIIAGI